MYNPIIKNKFIPDVEARVFNDRLYMYGSKDKENGGWCSAEYEVFSTKDFKTIAEHGVSLRLSEMKNNPAGHLYAPDCIEKDGRYYLFSCCDTGTEWVSEGKTPIRFEDSSQIEGISGIDPSVFIDDDGQAYLFWGQFSLNGARLTDDMRGIDFSTFTKNIVTQDSHFFHEGSSIRKRNGIYYLIFSDVSRGKKTQYGGTPTCLGYATAVHPLGPYTYRGVIIDNIGCDPNTWNNHGCIACYQGQWYIFYHRGTAGQGFLRRCCVEKIFFDEKGLIPEVLMTSSGASDYIPAREFMEAAAFCVLSGTCYLDTMSSPEYLSHICAGDSAVIRYIKFEQEQRIVLQGAGSGDIAILYDDRHGNRGVLSECHIQFDEGVFHAPVAPILGVYELTFCFKSSENLMIRSVQFK